MNVMEEHSSNNECYVPQISELSPHESLQTFWSPGSNGKKTDFFGQKIKKMSKNSDFGSKNDQK